MKNKSNVYKLSEDFFSRISSKQEKKDKDSNLLIICFLHFCNLLFVYIVLTAFLRFI